MNKTRRASRSPGFVFSASPQAHILWLTVSDEIEKKKSLRSIPTSRFARGYRMAKLTAAVSAQALGGKMANLFGDVAEKQIKTLAGQVKQAKMIADTLSQMKGAAMKLGQILSIHGEHLFPKEVVEVLNKLQQHSDELEFGEIEKVLKKELGSKLGTELTDVSSTPIASASIGQVHRAVHKGVDVAVKVQYPGVDKSIDSDVDSLASLFTMLTRFPSVEGFNSVTEEIKMVLRLETDYLQEGKNLEFFRNYFKSNDKIVVPRFYPEVSTSRVLTTSLVKGISVQEFAASTASAKARANLGARFLEVFYNEMFSEGRVQTDPNFANYKIEWSFGIDDPKLVLLDFGAVKTFDDEFRTNYKRLARACLSGDYDAIRTGAIEIGFLRAEDPKELVDMHYELTMMFTEPFMVNGAYDWAGSGLAERVRKFMPKFIFAFKLRPPPRDFIFLNRKIVGVYFFCSAIKAEFNPRPLLETFTADAAGKVKPRKG